MNSTTLLQLACTAWLSAPDQSALTLQEMELMLSAVNAAMYRVWRLLPASYRQQTFSCAFDAAVAGTITATQGSRAATFSFPGSPSPTTNFLREFCTLGGGSVRNEFRLQGLLHPWQEATGTHAATLYHDATIKLGYLVERLLAPMVELRRKEVWTPATAMESVVLWGSSNRVYSLQRLSFPEQAGGLTMRTLFRVAKLDGSPRVFESVVSVLPLPLTVLDAAVPVDVPFDEEVADVIAAAAGIELQTHPRWKGGEMSRATGALDRLRDLSPTLSSDPMPFGTPEGW